MAKVSPNSIDNMSQDWGLDENTNLPFSGEAVQTFIKSYLRQVTAAAWFDTSASTMYFFDSEEHRDIFIGDTSRLDLVSFSCPMNFSGTLYQIKVTNYNESQNLNVATNSGTAPLSLSFVVQEKSISATTWNDTPTPCWVTIYIDRGLTGEYVALTERTLTNPEAIIRYDVFNNLANGGNRVKFVFEAEDGSVTSAFTYTITLAELYIELFNNFWYQPILGGDNSTYQLGGFRIAGAGYKTFHLSLYDSLGAKVVDDLTYGIGQTNSYASTPFYYRFDANSPIAELPTGVYTVEVFVSVPGLESEHLSYNVMFVAEDDTTTAKLICINNVADKIYNYADANLCEYSIYNGVSSTANIVATFRRRDGISVVGTTTQELDGMTTGVTHVLSYQVIWPNIEGTGYSLGFTLGLDNEEVGAIVPIDNSTVFPPVSDYDFYLLAATRSNSESNKNKIINLADNSELSATWTAVDFFNGYDGWTQDDDNRTCLRIPAGSKVVLPATSFKLFSGDNQTFEICYKVVNVADYDEDVITIGTGHGTDGFSGVRIKPTNVTVHSKADLTATNDIYQSTNLCDEDTIHFALTVNPYYEGNHKLVKGFINGGKNFEFSYPNGGDWNIDGGLTIGSNKSDVFVYLIRHYPIALSDTNVQVNYINSLGTVAERNDTNEKFLSVLDSGQLGIDYENVKNNDYNFFVITMTQGNGVPSIANGWGKKTEGKSILEMHFGEHPEWDWKIENPETMGQGTTSMNYYRWNIRWRIDKTNIGTSAQKKMVPVSYVTSRTRAGGRYRYEWGESEWATTVRFDGNNHPPVMRITAKINMASSMQSHKMGATRAYTELHDAIGLRNEAQELATPMPTVAVYEYPAFGFEYDPGSDTYTYIGLFTIGPDKGDKPTFGYNVSGVKNTLISMEGTDHNQPLAKFSYPWNGDVNYFYDEEGLAINLGEGNYLTGLEVSNCHGLGTDSADDQASLRSVLVNEFKPAYEVAWKNSTLIFPISQSHSTYGSGTASQILDNINADIDNFRAQVYGGRLTVADMQFWIENDPYKYLYYYDEKDKIYKSDVSLYNTLGDPPQECDTLTKKNEWYKEQRRANFIANAGNFWDLDDCIYHYVFCVAIGATDNFAKNSYPYKMATLQSGGRWKWRQDDLDSIFDIDNSGRDSKPFYIEYEDSIGGTAYFAGSNSVFWTLIHECFWDDYNNGAGKGIRSIGRQVVNAMASLSNQNNPYDGFVKYIEKCFWNNAQKYFPESAYNEDARFKYEQAWLVNGQTVPPLTQALGSHYSGEQLWVRRRAVYILSLFRAGGFADNTDSRSLGQIAFRPTSITVRLSPVFRMYPSLLTGQGGLNVGERTDPNQYAEITPSGSLDGNTFAYIAATNYMTSLGNFKNIVLGLQDINNVTITGAKLTEFVIGDLTAGNVTTNIPGLVFTNNACLETIDARNASSITAITGLDKCIRLRSLLLEGTSLSIVDIPSGSKLETLTLPDTITRISLRNLKHLTSLDVNGCSSVESLVIEECPGISPFGLLEDTIAASSVLESIRLIWYTPYVDNAGTTPTLLASIADGDYTGIDADGREIATPFLEGVIDVSSGHNQVRFPISLDITSDEAYEVGKRRVQIGNFNTSLSVIYSTATAYFLSYLCEANGGRIKTSDGKYITV